MCPPSNGDREDATTRHVLDPNEKFDIGVIVWLIRGGGKNILFDTGYYRKSPGFEQWNTQDFVRPDEAVKLAAQLAPQVVLMDVAMPQLNGVEATRQILRRQSSGGLISA